MIAAHDEDGKLLNAVDLVRIQTGVVKLATEIGVSVLEELRFSIGQASVDLDVYL